MKRKGIGFYLRIYGKILAQDLKSKMSYRADFIIFTIGMIFTNIAGFVSFWILFRNFPSINGWSYYEMLFLYGFSLVSLTPVQCLFDNNWNLRMYVYSGDFIKYCFRPINLFFYYQSEIFDIKGLGQFAFGIGTLAYAWGKIGLPITIFSPVFRFIFTFIIPIAFIAYYPSLVILRPDEIPILSWISPLIGGLFFWLSYKFWMYGAIKYSGTGS